MPRKKLIRFEENATRKNVLEPGKPLYETIKGNWQPEYFHNDHPIVAELGCGRGEYTNGLAMQIPGKNFVGVDVKGERLWQGSVVAETQKLQNVAFLRTSIQQLDDFFVPGELSEIWLTFPDPRPRDRDERHRLTHPRFLEIYRKLLIPGAWVHLKTDNQILFDYTLQVLREQPVKDLRSTTDLYQSDLISYHYGIKTRYELKYAAAGMKINYLQFKFES